MPLSVRHFPMPVAVACLFVATLEGFESKMPSATKVGDGEPWALPITVKGGNAAFYSIGVGKGLSPSP